MYTSAALTIPDGPIDAHVHLVGNGSGGSGCRLRLHGWRRAMGAVMLRQLRLPLSVLRGDLDRLYAERLLALVRESSLAAAVILAQDRAAGPDGKMLEDVLPFYVPNEHVLELGRRYAEFLPGVSIHPARPDAMDELERCLAGGAVLMKCLPISQSIDCNDRRYVPFWERMAEARLPLLAHTGTENTLPVLRPDLGCPSVLRLPLECGVRVIAAHCGTRSSPLARDTFDVFAEMTRRHPNLYGDSSAMHLPFRGDHLRECLAPPLVDRMIHGSDCPVPVFGHWLWLRGMVGWRAYRDGERGGNILERDYRLKMAMGFPPRVFTRVRELLLRP